MREGEMNIADCSLALTDVLLPGSPSNSTGQLPVTQCNGDSSNARQNGAAPGELGGGRKEDFVKKYNCKLLAVKCGALLTTVLHSFNQFVGFCALTWATVVILGGFVADLSKHDFYSVSVLLLLEAIRLAAAVFFGNIVTRKLVYRSIDPTKITYDDVQRQVLVEVLRNLDQAFQLTIVAISVVVPLRRLQNLGSSKGNSFDGLHDSLFIFYVLVLMNAIIAVIGVVLSKTITPLYVKSYDLRRFYDSIVWRGMDKGFLRAKDVDFLTFAMKAQADEYQRNLRAPAVYSLYKELVEYLYHEKKGFEVVCLSLDTGDTYEREAAANIVGLWTKLEDSKRPRLRLQKRLLSRLADAVDNEETGRAATSSFEQLAKVDPQGLLGVKTSSGEKLVDVLINCIKEVVEVGRHDRALVYTKALIPLLENDFCRREIAKDELKLSLKDVFKDAGCLKRVKAVAGYALKLLGEEPTEEEIKTYLRVPPPTPKEHILKNEEKFLLELLRTNEVPLEWRSNLKVREIDQTAVPVFFARPATSLIPSIVPLFVVSLASFFFLKKVSF